MHRDNWQAWMYCKNFQQCHTFLKGLEGERGELDIPRAKFRPLGWERLSPTIESLSNASITYSEILKKNIQ